MLIQLPETHREILRGYKGAYSLGVGEEPRLGREPVLILQVERAPEGGFPSRVKLAGHSVPVVVRTGFVAPRPQPARLPHRY